MTIMKKIFVLLTLGAALFTIGCQQGGSERTPEQGATGTTGGGTGDTGTTGGGTGGTTGGGMGGETGGGTGGTTGGGTGGR